MLPDPKDCRLRVCRSTVIGGGGGWRGCVNDSVHDEDFEAGDDVVMTCSRLRGCAVAAMIAVAQMVSYENDGRDDDGDGR